MGNKQNAIPRPTVLTPVDYAGICIHRYALTADGVTTHHIIAKYGSNTCKIHRNCGEHGFRCAGELMRRIENVTINDLF